MTPSKECLDFIKHYEACRLKAYLPTPNDVPTIGWGSTGKDIHLGLVWTQWQADSRFYSDGMKVAVAVNSLIGTHPTTQHQFDALVSFTYNVGAQALHDSTLLREHLAGQYAAAAGQFMKWVYQNKTVLGGLLTRRGAEQAMYLKP